MDRIAQLLKYADTTKPGIEVAPYFNPSLRKADGHPVLTMDVFDTETLRRSCVEDPLTPTDRAHEIEEVDIVGDASSIGAVVRDKGLAGQVHYVISSHNFEHLPNPVRFLRGCAEVLAPGGMVSLAVPDCRACFDFYRYPTRLADWLDAYHEDRAMPSPATVFDASSMVAYIPSPEGPRTGCALGVDDPDRFVPERKLRDSYAEYLARRAGASSYRDAHVSVFFPQTAELMLRDLRHLGLLDLEIVEVSPTFGHEFFIHLRKPDGTPETETDEAFHVRRVRLMAEISRNLGRAPYDAAQRAREARLGRRIEKRAKAALTRLLGEDRFRRLDAWHRANVRNRRKR